MDLRGTGRWAAGAAALVVVLSGCGQTAVGAAVAPVTGEAPGPIPVVEPTCSASYPSYSSAAALVARADVVVRVAATGPSRDYRSYPLPPPSDDLAGSPQAGMSPEELARYREEAASDATAITVRAVEVLKGDVEVGDAFEVSQNPCTERPLPVGEGREYLMALELFDPAFPLNQLNDSQATWQVVAGGGLAAVDPRNDLGVTAVDQLADTLRDVGASVPQGSS